MKKPGKLALWFLIFAGNYFLFREIGDLLRQYHFNDFLFIEEIQDQDHRLLEGSYFLGWGPGIRFRSYKNNRFDDITGLADKGDLLSTHLNRIQLTADGRMVHRDFKTGKQALECAEDVSSLQRGTSHFSEEGAQRAKTVKEVVSSSQGDGNRAIDHANRQPVLKKSHWPRDTLSFGEVLRTGDKLMSQNFKYILVNLRDGNLVLYNQDAVVVGTSGTANRGPANLFIRGNGQLALYKALGDGSAANRGPVIWSTPLFKNKTFGPHKLVLRDDGKLVIYDAYNNPTWHGRLSTEATRTPRT